MTLGCGEAPVGSLQRSELMITEVSSRTRLLFIPKHHYGQHRLRRLERRCRSRSTALRTFLRSLQVSCCAARVCCWPIYEAEAAGRGVRCCRHRSTLRSICCPRRRNVPVQRGWRYSEAVGNLRHADAGIGQHGPFGTMKRSSTCRAVSHNIAASDFKPSG